MSLDYWNPDAPVNFRDAFEWVNAIAETPTLPTGRIYRGGTIKYIRNLNTINSPKTIFNLRRGPDPEFDGATTYHFPISNTHEVYNTTDPVCHAWLQSMLDTIAAGIEYPLYIHCLSGKDRTGVFIGLLLLILGFSHADIIEDYLLSDGEVDRTKMVRALNGMTPPEAVFPAIDLDTIRKMVLSV